MVVFLFFIFNLSIMRNNFFLVLILIILNISCSLGQKNKNTFNKFNETNIKWNNFMPFSKGVLLKILIKDSILTLASPGNNNKYLFSYYNMNTKNMIREDVEYGPETNQILNPLSIGINNNYFWVHDITSNKVLVKNIKKQDNFVVYKLPEFYYSVLLDDSLNIYGNGNFSSEKNIQKINLKNKDLVKEIGYLEPAPKDITEMAWKRANESFIFLKPNNDKLVAASRLTDELVIVSLNNNSTKKIKGPEGIDLKFKAYKLPDGKDMIQREDETCFTFSDGFTSEKYIYLLYSGNLHTTENLAFGKKIFVYDWEGNPVKQLNLPSYISCFTVINDKEVYAYAIKENCINYFNIDLN
jgi:hypothetical protein